MLTMNRGIKNFYVDGYSIFDGGYSIYSKAQGDCRVATFVTEMEAQQYAQYRNKMLDKYNTTDVTKYE